MSTMKPFFSATPSAAGQDHDQSERQLALEYLAEAWNSAEDEGIESKALAHASLFAALATFVKLYGDDAAAALIEMLPDRIRAGEYDLERVIQ